MIENHETIDEKRILQLEELKILLELDRVCKSLGITYFLFSGTLLGAVRHKGFIPWDDDIDVAIIRDEYDRFIKEAPGVLDSNFFLQTVESDPQYPYVFAKVRNSKTTFIESDLSDLKINHGIYIDIFPIDGAPSNKVARSIWWKIITFVDNIVLLKSSRIEKDRRGFRFIQFLGRILPLSSKSLIHLQQGLCKLRKPKNARYLAFTTDPSVSLDVIIYDKNWFDDVVEVEFEGYRLPAPREYDKVLRALYKEYMVLPPMEKRVSPHGSVKMSIDTSYEEYL